MGEQHRPLLPGERYQFLLAHLYGRGADGQVSLGSGSDFAELLNAFTLLGESEQRLRELRTLLVRAITNAGGGLLGFLGPTTQSMLSMTLADPSRVDGELLDSIRRALTDVNEQVGSVPFVRLQVLLAPIVESCRRLLDDSAAPLDIFLPDLHSIASQAYTLAGRFAFETRDDEASRSLYAAATTAAGGAIGAPWRRAMVHMSHALVTLYSTSDLDAAMSLVDAAVRDARAGESVTVRARTHALQAEIAARAGSKKHARAALALAWYDIDSCRDSDPSSSLTSFSPAHLRGFEGVTSLYVGDPSEAHDYFARSVASLSAPRECVQRAIVATDQAAARIRMDNPQAATALLHDCVDAAASTGGRVASIRLRRARRDLHPWRREDFVTDLDDHMFDVL